MRDEITIEEKVEKVRDFRPIDDAFFEVLANDISFCQEMLRIHKRGRNLSSLRILLLCTYHSLTYLMVIV